ncbi:hypothetical protein M0R04_15780 [Candidatus Dojkabacteria bacterium]|jgi:hypothetical protein|nr:hypothetical protein [Candidatus Dojkabacteria bacterium]
MVVTKRKQGRVPKPEEQDVIVEEAKKKEVPQQRKEPIGMTLRDRQELEMARQKNIITPQPSPEELNLDIQTKKNKGLAAGEISRLNEQPSLPVENIEEQEDQGFLINKLTQGVSAGQSNLGKVATMGSNVAGATTNIAAAGALGWAAATGLLAIPSAAVIAPKVLGNSKLAKKFLTFAGVGSLSGITAKIGLAKRQATTDANNILTNAKSNIGSIISSLNAGAITPQEATELFNKEKANLNMSERALKQLTKNDVTTFLSGAKDEMADLNDYKYGSGLLLDTRALELAINKFYGVVQ